MRTIRHGWFRGLVVLALLAVVGRPVFAADTEVELRAVLAELDSDEFDRREAAFLRLLHWADEPHRRRELAVAIERRLAASDTSGEVRLILTPLLHQLAALPVETAPSPPTSAQWTAAIDALDDDQFARRWNARVQLEAWLQRDLAVGPIFTELKLRQQVASSETHSREYRTRLSAVLEVARAAWLRAEPDRWPLAPLDEAELQRLVTRLTQDPVGDELALEAVRQELADRLAHPPDAQRVLVALETPLQDKQLAVDAQQRLTELIQLTKPAMVAEIWNGSAHRTIQHLLIGVPAQVAGAPNPTHFDRIDDRTAHCVSGNSLTLGDWPVGMFFPSPRTPAWSTQFFLLNLPTARARLAYDHWVERPEQERFRELTRRSTRRWLDDRRTLSVAEIAMLGQLDREPIYDFVPRYLTQVDDAPLTLDLPLPDALQSRHSLLCLALTTYGNAAVGRALSDRAVQQRVDCPGGLWPRLALVACGTRQAWPELDRTLIDIVADNELSDDVLAQLDIRATAAALLLTRSNVSTAAFGLERDSIREEELSNLLAQIAYPEELRFRAAGNDPRATWGTRLFKFTEPAARGRVLSWWRDREHAKAFRP